MRKKWRCSKATNRWNLFLRRASYWGSSFNPSKATTFWHCIRAGSL